LFSLNYKHITALKNQLCAVWRANQPDDKICLFNPLEESNIIYLFKHLSISFLWIQSQRNHARGRWENKESKGARRAPRDLRGSFQHVTLRHLRSGHLRKDQFLTRSPRFKT